MQSLLDRVYKSTGDINASTPIHVYAIALADRLDDTACVSEYIKLFEDFGAVVIRQALAATREQIAGVPDPLRYVKEWVVRSVESEDWNE